MQVHETVRYAFNDTSSEGEWASLNTILQAPLRVDDEKHIATPSMFHELHCVYMMREALFQRVSLHHAQHCANLLRRWSLCRADLTLEPGDFTDRDFDIDRAGAVHVCRDWTQVLKEAHANWEDWKVFWADHHLWKFVVYFYIAVLFTELETSDIWDKRHSGTEVASI